ncbi:MAG: hemagglutinin repeat-containing protein [Candidatus Thiodiazotropha sp. (ex Monitilora ramsayi)]|nr:hemagglutinin repeat-containing protein [Candidatus Thiodiazotropha sp. (ex Monitilora ramsayi)]
MKRTGSTSTNRIHSHGAWRLSVCTALSWCLVLQPVAGIAAGVVVDTAAPANQQAQVTSANNGVPMVQIAAPNTNGLSHNQYTDFNVSSQGLILNNAQSATTTQLGGAVLANPNLQQAGATANIILNEVTSTNRSRLEGFQEVAGDRADLILANPNGITCRGCGFINTPRATLSTGRPLVDNGVLQGFEVRDGDILIEGEGVNAQGADAFDLVSRRLQLDGAVNGHDVHIVTGANRVDYVTRGATAIAGTGDAPAYLVDSSALGGVYADRIFLLGNEHGVGVRLRGDMATSVGEIALRNDGRIELTGNGLMAAGDLNVKSGEAALSMTDATLHGSEDLVLNSGALTMTRATTVADARAAVATAGNLTLSDSTLGGRTSLNIDVGHQMVMEDSLVASDQVLAIETTTLYVDAASRSGKGVVSGGDLTITATASGSDITNAGDILGRDITLRAPRFILNLATGLVSGDNSVDFDNLINRGQVIGGRIQRTGGDLTTNNFGELLAGADGISIQDSLINHPGALLHAIGDIELGAAGATVRNEQARIESYNGTVTLNAARFENIGATPELVWDYDNTVKVESGSAGGGALPIYSDCGTTADHFDAGRVGYRCARSVRRTHQEVGLGQLPDPARLLAAGDVRFTGGEFLNQQGIVAAGGDVAIDAGLFTNITVRRLTRDTTFDPSQPYNAGFTGYVYQDGGTDLLFCAANPDACFGGGRVKQFGIVDATWVFDNGHGPVDPAWGGVVQAGGTLSINATQVQNGHAPTGGAPYNGSAPASPTLPGVTSGLPNGGSLFVPTRDPGAVVLIETDPRFNLDLLLQGFGGSQLLLDELSGQDIDGQTSETVRLGDAYFETLLVRDEVMQLTGMRFIYDDLATDVGQFQQLMDNALTESQALDLRLGVALDQDQISKLNKDIVWMVETEYKGRKVLQPKVYLTERTLARLGRGETLTARNIEIDAASAFTNAGTMKANGTTRVTADAFTNRGITEGGAAVSITATAGDVRNSGVIRGGDVALSATGGDVVNENLARREALVDGYTTREGARGQIEASGDLLMEGENVVMQGGTSAAAAGTATLHASGDVRLEAQAYSDERRSSTTRRSGLFGVNSERTERVERTTRIEGAQLSGAGGVKINAGRDVRLIAAEVASEQGGISIDAGREVAIETAKEEVYDYASTTRERIFSESRADATDQGRLAASAGADIYSKQTTTTENRDETVIGSRLQAGSGISINSGGKSTLRSAELDAGQGPISISGSEVELLADQENDLHRTDTENLTVGVAASADTRDQFTGFKGQYRNDKETTQSVTQRTNRLQGGGDVSITAHRGDVREQGSEILAGRDIDVSARAGNVISEAVKDSTTTTRETETIGGELGAGARTGIASDIETTVRNDPAVTRVDPKDLDADSSAISSGTLFYGGRAGGEYQQSRTEQLDEKVRTSRWQAGGDIAIDAADDVHLQATQLATDSGDIALRAGNEVRIEAVTERHESRSESTGGQGELIASNNSGTLAGHYDTQSESERLGISRTSHIDAGGDLSIQAGGDLAATGVKGKAGGDVRLQAGGDLSLNAAHDTYEHSRKGMAADGRLSLKRNMKTGPVERVYDFGSGGVTGRQSTGKGGALEGQYRGVDESTTGDIARVSGFEAGGDLSVRAKQNVILEGTQLSAQGDGEITAEQGDIDYRAVEDRFSTKRDNLQVYGKLSGAKSKDKQAGPAATGRLGKAWGAFGVARGKVSELTMKYKQDGTTVDIEQTDNETVQARGGSFDFGGKAVLKAGKDINLQGTQAVAGGRMVVNAGGDLNLEAAESRTRIDTNTLNAGAGLRQTGFMLGSTDINATRHQNANLQGGEVVTRSGGDTTLAGAGIEGRIVNTHVGGDLTVVSKVDWVDFEVGEQGVILGTAVGEGGGGRLDGFAEVIHSIKNAPDHFKSENKAESGNVRGVSSPSGIRSRQGTVVNVEGETRLEGGHILQQDAPATLKSRRGLQKQDVEATSSDDTTSTTVTTRNLVGQGDAGSVTDDPLPGQGQGQSKFFTEEVQPAIDAEDDAVREMIEQQR